MLCELVKEIETRGGERLILQRQDFLKLSLNHFSHRDLLNEALSDYVGSSENFFFSVET